MNLEDGIETIFGENFGIDSDAEEEEDKEKRTQQTEEEFLRQKRGWVPKLENREVMQFEGQS